MSRRWQRRLGLLLATAGVAWVVAMLHGERALLGRALLDVDGGGLALVLGLGLASLLPLVEVFRRLLVGHGGPWLGFVEAGRLLFVGQLLRHLPGRFLGVVWQLEATRDRIPAGMLVRVNLDYMWVATLYMLVVALGLLGIAALGPLPGGALLAAGFLFAAGLLRLDLPGRALALGSAQLPERLRLLSPALRRIATPPWAAIAGLSLLQAGSWLLYLGAWEAFGIAWPMLADLPWLSICAQYSLAWLVGFATLVTPAGVGVREAAFMAFADGPPMAVVALVAVLARLWLLALDLLVCLLFLLLPLRPRMEALP